MKIHVSSAGFYLVVQKLYFLNQDNGAMTEYIVLTSVTLFSIFILFLVIGRTMNSIINLLIKTEYLLQKEHDLKKEALDVRRMMEEQVSIQEKKENNRT